MNADRIQYTESLFRRRCVDQGFFLTGDDRVGEADAAALLCLSPGSLKNMRTQGSGPMACMRGFRGGRVSYRLSDLAEWVEQGMQNNHPTSSNGMD